MWQQQLCRRDTDHMTHSTHIVISSRCVCWRRNAWLFFFFFCLLLLLFESTRLGFDCMLLTAIKCVRSAQYLGVNKCLSIARIHRIKKEMFFFNQSSPKKSSLFTEYSLANNNNFRNATISCRPRTIFLFSYLANFFRCCKMIIINGVDQWWSLWAWLSAQALKLLKTHSPDELNVETL